MTTLRLTARLVGIAAVAALAWPSAVAAHAHLVSSSPEADAQLDEPPAEVVLTFDNELDPDASGFVVVDVMNSREVGGGGVDLDVAERNELRGEVAIDRAGAYTVKWSVLGTDGHQVSGSFDFAYGEIEGDANGTTPDTAMGAAPGASLAVLLGLGLMALSLAVTVRRLATRPARHG